MQGARFFIKLIALTATAFVAVSADGSTDGDISIEVPVVTPPPAELPIEEPLPTTAHGLPFPTPTSEEPLPTTQKFLTPTPAPTPTMFIPMPNATCSIEYNFDRPGFDLKNVAGPIESCEPACKATPGCVTFSWSQYNGGTCWLKKYPSDLVPTPNVATTTCVFPTTKPISICNDLKGIDFVGMDIGNKPALWANRCCEICDAFAGCSAYSWTNYNRGTCWLKKSVGHVIAKTGVTSASIVELDGPVCPFEYDVDFEGNDIGNKPAVDAGKCCSLCKATSACQAYSWSNYNGGTCWMKSGKGVAKEAKGVISAKLVGFEQLAS